jgi:hypothetical protein
MLEAPRRAQEFPIENEDLSYLVPMRSFLVGLAMMLLAGCVPGNIARSSCESIFLSTRDEWSCTVKGDIVGQASSIAFSTESRNQVAQVGIALRVTKGTLRVDYQDLSGDQHLLVTPSQPADLSMQTRMHREHRSFTLFFEPVGGVVEGLTGTVKYSTP